MLIALHSWYTSHKHDYRQKGTGNSLAVPVELSKRRRRQGDGLLTKVYRYGTQAAIESKERWGEGRCVE